MNSYLKQKTKYGRKNCLLDIPDKPRREEVAAFRLFTGYDYHAAYLYRIGILNEAAYNLCDKRNESMDKYQMHTYGDTKSSIYWETRGLLGL
ncbi:hypothetical protein NPIL_66151 [Nephila pilipes]|uniref:Uncharacterized protein n=1 Tax=Nephila pilipes TaxID=299642 RepID=A0A8X6NB82_NEPPI|nr:hypothetical protein NPIL_66151 [Nephila pilipes]